jgi:phenylacetate-coenzyme A ligase PaaK-like adenylate-forming protein
MNTLQNFKLEFERLLSCLYHHFPWYENLAFQRGYYTEFNPENLPYVDELTLNTYYYNSQTTEFINPLIYYTSGTSKGVRKKVIYSQEDHRQYLEQRKKIFSRFLFSDCQTACSDLGTGHAADSAAHIFEQLGVKHKKIDYRLPLNEHVEILNKYQPDLLFTMPMILDKIIGTGCLKWKPKKIIVVGDVASKQWKNNIVNYFGIPKSNLLDILGSIEVGSIAYECHDCGLYHFDAHIIPETIKPSDLYGNLDWNNKGEILILTSTARTYFPVIRFITNDLIEGFKMYECRGKKFFTFEKIIGRIGSEIKHGEKISFYDISEAVNTFLPEGEFEVYKNSESKRLIIKVCSPFFNKEVAKNIKLFLKRLNPDIEQMISSCLVEDIEVVGVSVGELSPSSIKRSFLIKT